jgi:hypothetical protein
MMMMMMKHDAIMMPQKTSFIILHYDVLMNKVWTPDALMCADPSLERSGVSDG